MQLSYPVVSILQERERKNYHKMEAPSEGGVWGFLIALTTLAGTWFGWWKNKKHDPKKKLETQVINYPLKIDEELKKIAFQFPQVVLASVSFITDISDQQYFQVINSSDHDTLTVWGNRLEMEESLKQMHVDLIEQPLKTGYVHEKIERLNNPVALDWAAVNNIESFYIFHIYTGMALIDGKPQAGHVAIYVNMRDPDTRTAGVITFAKVIGRNIHIKMDKELQQYYKLQHKVS